MTTKIKKTTSKKNGVKESTSDNVRKARKIFEQIRSLLDTGGVDIEPITEENQKKDGFFAILISKNKDIVSVEQVGKDISSMAVGESLISILQGFNEEFAGEVKEKKIGLA